MELKANELRIGNYVLDIDNDILSISEITKDYVSFNKCNLKSRYSKIKPISLTEEWLLKFGFKEKVYNESYPKNRFEKDIFNIYYTNQPSFNGYVLCEDDFVLRGVEFVHQLQNLYFALINEELEIKI